DKARAVRGEIDEVISLVARRLTEGQVPERFGWYNTVRTAINEEFAAVRTDLARQSEADVNFESVHALSDRQSEYVEGALAEALGNARERATELSLELVRIDAGLRDVQQHMNQAPESDEIAPIVSQLSEFQEQHARLALELTLKSEDCAKLERDLTGFRRELDRLMKAEAGARTLADRVSRAMSARQALYHYLTRGTTAQTEQPHA